MNNVWWFVHSCMGYVMHLGPRGWFIGFVLTLVAGIVCMRGFGSRNSF